MLVGCTASVTNEDILVSMTRLVDRDTEAVTEIDDVLGPVGLVDE